MGRVRAAEGRASWARAQPGGSGRSAGRSRRLPARSALPLVRPPPRGAAAAREGWGAARGAAARRGLKVNPGPAEGGGPAREGTGPRCAGAASRRT